MAENKQSLEVAGRQYDPSDYKSAAALGAGYKSAAALGAGLAETHEQVSDVYAEGTIEAAVEQENAPDIPLSPPE
ncbi:YozQ family protein [Geobacillus stearothermophilus]|uniref:YozQ family protein n=1 Tax=Geobacillus stearothermophilus TaxID=1422 RepID=UPI002E20240A|nr:YozQ family protein [Geobacillus stearothermophilus]MED4959874.1 YozQ family protein [Geobacillus stearothermophilus]